MKNRSEIISEYHDLVKKLNTANKFKNQKTELTFFKKTIDQKIHLCVTVNLEKFLTLGILTQ